MILAILGAGVYGTKKVQAQIADRVIRFHVRANSDGLKDQEMKLKVRDKVIRETKKYLEGCSSKKEAEYIILKHKGEIERTAKKVLEEEEKGIEVKVSYQKEKFPLRIYGEYAFPPGVYDALRIDIGKADGKNWWCIMYPSLCYLDETEEIFDSRARKSLEKVVGEKAYYELRMRDKKGKIKIKWKIYEILREYIA